MGRPLGSKQTVYYRLNAKGEFQKFEPKADKSLPKHSPIKEALEMMTYHYNACKGYEGKIKWLSEN